MSKRVLVAYASKYGATAEIAEKIGIELESAGLNVSVEDAGKVKDLADAAFVILGSAIYYGRWRKGATKFLKKFEKQLAGIPVWFFSSGPIGEGAPGIFSMAGVSRQISKSLLIGFSRVMLWFFTASWMKRNYLGWRKRSWKQWKHLLVISGIGQ